MIPILSRHIAHSDSNSRFQNVRPIHGDVNRQPTPTKNYQCMCIAKHTGTLKTFRIRGLVRLKQAQVTWDAIQRGCLRSQTEPNAIL